MSRSGETSTFRVADDAGNEYVIFAITETRELKRTMRESRNRTVARALRSLVGPEGREVWCTDEVEKTFCFADDPNCTLRPVDLDEYAQAMI